MATADASTTDRARAWTAAAATVLRRGRRLAADAPDEDAWDVLTRTTVEGIAIPPLATADQLTDLPTAPAMTMVPGRAPFLRGARVTGGWDVRVLVEADDPAASEQVSEALDGGADSLWLRLTTDAGADPVAQARSAVAATDLAAVPVVLETVGGDGTSAAVTVMEALAAGSSHGLHRDSTLGVDPIATAVREASASGGTSWSVDNAGDLPDLTPAVTAARDLGIRALLVDATAVHDAGAGEAIELGYSLAVGAAYLRALVATGLDVDTACALIDFRYAATDHQFLTIAKLRAARLAWFRICQLSGASAAASAQHQHAVTSRPMLTRYDPYVNMVRGTIAAFAAGVGGAAAVTVLPFDAARGRSDAFGQRMARNVSALLQGESSVGAVADPAGGSYAVEVLTHRVAEAGWDEFGRLETAGGVLAALADGSLATRIERVRAERGRRIATRQQPITGVSEFPDPGEEPWAVPPPDTMVGVHPWAAPFETLRDHPPSGQLLLVRIGTEAAASARLLFAENLLHAGGITLRTVAVDSDLAASVGRADAVMFAGSPDDYRAQLADAVATVRAAGAREVFLAGRVPSGTGLVDTDIDATVAAGDDVLAFLHTVRRAVGASS